MIKADHARAQAQRYFPRCVCVSGVYKDERLHMPHGARHDRETPTNVDIHTVNNQCMRGSALRLFIPTRARYTDTLWV